MRYESSSSISISEKSSESCDVSADMVTLRLPNERIVERSCEASRSGRRGSRLRTGVARTGRRALSCESSGGRVETESAGVAATSNGARVCARAGRDAGSFKISRQTGTFLPALLGFKRFHGFSDCAARRFREATLTSPDFHFENDRAVRKRTRKTSMIVYVSRFLFALRARPFASRGAPPLPPPLESPQDGPPPDHHHERGERHDPSRV